MVDLSGNGIDREKKLKQVPPMTNILSGMTCDKGLEFKTSKHT